MATSITGQGIAAYKAPDDALSSESKNAVQNKVIDEELSDVKNALGVQPDGVLTLYPRTWKSEAGYYYKSGRDDEYTWRSISDYITSEKIPLNDAKTVVVKTIMIDTKASRIQFWNNNDEVFADYGEGVTGETTLQTSVANVPSGAVYVSYTAFEISAGDTRISLSSVPVTAFGEITKIENSVEFEQAIQITYTGSGAFYRNGTIFATNAYDLTDYIPCEAGDKFIFESYGIGGSYYFAALYDLNKSLLCFRERGTGYTAGVLQEKTLSIDIFNAKYIRFTVYHDSNGDVFNCVKKKLGTGSSEKVITLNRQSLDEALGAGVNKGRFLYTNANAPDSFVLLHFSDIHGNGENLKNISTVKDYLSDVLDDTLCTGDIMESNYANSYDFWDANSDGSILTCIGNHDVHRSGSTYLDNQETEATLYGRYMENYISGWNVEHSGTNLYYYKDYPAKKIRLIVLNLLYPTEAKVTEQNTWLASVLSGAKTAGYGVVIGEHYYPVSGTRIESRFSALVNFPNSMSNPGNYMYNGDALTTYQATVQSFIDGDGNFVCWLCGHKHADYLVYHPSYPKQLFIGVGGALFISGEHELGYTSDVRRVKGTRSQDCMNVLSIDPAEKKIRVIRIGCDRDFLGRHRGSAVLDYSTSPATVVYED